MNLKHIVVSVCQSNHDFNFLNPHFSVETAVFVSFQVILDVNQQVKKEVYNIF